MIYIAINVIFNTMILAFAFMSVAGFTKVGAHVPEWQLTAIAYAILAILTLVGYSKLGTNIVGLFQPWRKMAGREKTRLEPLFSEIIEQTNRKYGTTYRLSDFKIKVTDNRMVNACALGYNTIAVNKGALNSFTDNQLQALLAHEMGHLYYRDSVRSCALIFSAFATRLIMWLYVIYAVIAAAIAEAEKGTKSVILTLVSLVPLLVFLPILILNWIGAKVFTLLNMAMSRKAEYRADAFSASLGYKADMISALEVFDDLSAGSDNSFMGKLMSTHPATMLRIGALEDSEVAKQNIGGLFVATPFAPNNPAGVAGNSEVIRLLTVLLIAGVLWCGMGFWGSYSRKAQVFFDVSSPVATISDNQVTIINVNASDPSATQGAHQALGATNVPAHAAKRVKAHKNGHGVAVNNRVLDSPVDNMVHINNVYKVSDSTYTVSYTYHGATSTAIKYQNPTGSTMTYSVFNSL